MTATEASRSFASVLNAVERGETVVITRGGRRIATMGPTTLGNGAEVRTLLADPPDVGFAEDVRAARAMIEPDALEWAAD